MAAQQTGTTSTDQKQQRDRQERAAPEQTQPRQDARLARLDSLALVSPLALLQRFFNDDLFNMVGALAGRTTSTRRSREGASPAMVFVPKVDVVQRDNELVVRADLPGVKPDEVTGVRKCRRLRVVLASIMPSADVTTTATPAKVRIADSAFTVSSAIVRTPDPQQRTTR